MTELNLRALQREESTASRSREPDETEEPILLERWVERPDGRMEQLLVPLTPEDYLNPQFGDKWLQGRPHSEQTADIADRLRRWFRSRPDILVLNDVQHRLGPGFPNPSPDVSVIRGARHPDANMSCFDVVVQGVVPHLIVEVISPRSPRIRRVDEIDKVTLYQQVGVPEYLRVDLPRRRRPRYQISGHRLDQAGVYQSIVSDEQGRVLSETTGLWFSISSEGNRIVIQDVATGEFLRTSEEEEERGDAAEAKAAAEAEARQAAELKARAAEAKAAAEAEARRAAEAELARLRAEIERLRGGG